jgi:hypothetical protein
MAQVLTRNEAQTVIFDLLDSVYEVEGEKAKPTFEKYMKVKDMDRGQYISYRVAGFGKHTKRGDEMAPIDYDDYAFGEKQTINPEDWATGLRVSENVVKDLMDAGPKDPYNVARLAAFQEVTRRFRKSANWAVEIECANRFVNFTSTTAAYLGRDGLAFGSASHVTLKNPPITWGNLQTAASLSAIQLQGMITTDATIPDDTGNYQPMNDAYIAMVSPYNMMRLRDIIATKGQVDTNNNNTNPLDDYTITPVINQYLGNANKGFFLGNPDTHTCTWMWREKPNFAKEGDFDTVSMKMRSIFRGVAFNQDPHGWLGNLGA